MFSSEMLKLPEGNAMNSKTLATGHLVAPADHRAIGAQQGEGLAQPTADELGHPAARMDNKRSSCICLYNDIPIIYKKQYSSIGISISI